MLKRDFEDKLLEWKNNSHKKAFCIFGARQIGKTTTVREFAKKHYKYFCEINFFETPKAKEIFNGDLNADTIIMGISLIIGGVCLLISLYNPSKVFPIIAYSSMFVGIVVGSIISFYAMIKYNGGIF